MLYICVAYKLTFMHMYNAIYYMFLVIYILIIVIRSLLSCDVHTVYTHAHNYY